MRGGDIFSSASSAAKVFNTWPFCSNNLKRSDHQGLANVAQCRGLLDFVRGKGEC